MLKKGRAACRDCEDFVSIDQWLGVLRVRMAFIWQRFGIGSGSGTLCSARAAMCGRRHGDEA